MIFCCNETHVTSDVLDPKLDIPGYNCVRSDSTSRLSAGIVIYVHRTVQYKIVDEIVYEFNNIIVVDVLNSPCRGR